MAKTVQRQSIVSTLIIFAGFGFGALNLIVLQKWLLTPEQWGFTRVIADSAVLLTSFSNFGSSGMIAKFFPFYKHYLPAHKNDLPFVSLLLAGVGMGITLFALWIFQPQIILIFGKNNPLFITYYFTLFWFVLFQGAFMSIETHAWFNGKSVLVNLLKELVIRVFTSILLLLIALKITSFDGFARFFGFIYLPPAIILFMAIKRAGGLHFQTSISRVTKRLKRKMISLSSFVFLTNISAIGFTVCDTLFLAGLQNFTQAGIYAVVQYFSQVLEVPMRSMQSSSAPIISEYWHNKNMTGMASIYKKSCITLLAASIGLGGFILVNIHNIERYFGSEYFVIVVPLIILIVSRWVNLGTGLNALIIQLSSHWHFDFASTLIYSLLGIPLNFFLIMHFGMTGAAIANLLAMLIYNSIRFTFIWKKFKLQPFGWQNLWLLLSGSALIILVSLIPALPNLYIDGILRSILFLSAYLFLIIRFNFSTDISDLYYKQVNKLKQHFI